MRDTNTEDVEDELAFDLIDRLRKGMRASGHNSVTLADALGVHPNTISNYMSGRVVPDRRTLIAIAFAVGHGVTVEWLETGERVGSNPPGGRQDGGDPVKQWAEHKLRGRGGAPFPKSAGPESGSPPVPCAA